MEELIIDTSKNLFTTRSEFKCSGYGLSDLLRDKGKISGIEIGCDIGDTAYFLLKTLPNLSLTSIDPYTDYVDWNGNNLVNRNDMYNQVLKRMEEFGDRFTLIRDISDNVFDTFEDGTMDFIFIDGLHTYDQLTKDCTNFYSKVTEGGIFSGHDFTAISGVNRAANEFANLQNKEILTTECDVWYWYK